MYVEVIKFANHKPGLRRGVERTMISGPQRISNNSRPLVDSKFFRFLTFYLAHINNKFKIIYNFMVLCLESNVLEVVNTDDIIKGFASQYERKNYLY
jgi:hypothetical protein